MMDVQGSRIPAMATEEFGAGEIKEVRGGAVAGQGASARLQKKKARSAVALSPEESIAHHIFRARHETGL